MKKYKIPGRAQPLSVRPEDEEKFLRLNPDAVLVSGKSDSSSKSAGAEQGEVAQVETNQSQNNQQKTTELASGSGSSELQDLSDEQRGALEEKYPELKQYSINLNNHRYHKKIKKQLGYDYHDVEDIEEWVAGGKIYKIKKYDLKKFLALNDDAKKVEPFDLNKVEDENTFIRGDISSDFNWEEVSVTNMEEAADAGWSGLRQEKRLRKFLEEKFENQVDNRQTIEYQGQTIKNPNYGKSLVRFNEVRGGQDAIEVLVGNQEAGEGKIFKWGGLFGFKKGTGIATTEGKKELFERDRRQKFNDMMFHIKKNLNKDYHNNYFNFLDQLTPDDSTTKGNITWEERSSESQAKIADHFDKKILEMGGRPSWMDEDKHAEVMAEYEKTGSLPLDDIWKYKTDALVFDGEDWVSDDRGRLYRKEGSRGGGYHVRNIFELGTADHDRADMTGYLHLPDWDGDGLSDGTVGYETLFNDRVELRDIKLKRRWEEKRSQSIGEGARFETREDALKFQIDKAHQAMPWFDQEILDIKDRIEALDSGRIIVDGVEREMTEEELSTAGESLEMWENLLLKMITEKGYQEYYDPLTGEGVHPYTVGEWVDQGDDTSINTVSGVKMPNALLGDPQDVIEEKARTTTRENLENEVLENWIELMVARDLVVENMDVVEGGQKKLMRFLGNAFDSDNNSWDNTKQQLLKSYQDNSLFDLGGAFYKDEYIAEYDADGDGKMTDAEFDDYIKKVYGSKNEYLAHIEKIKVKETLMDLGGDEDALWTGIEERAFNINDDFLNPIYSTSDVAENYNSALKQYMTNLRALKMNINLRETREEQWGDELAKRMRHGFGTGAFGGEMLEDDYHDIFTSYLREKEGLEVPDHVYDSSEGSAMRQRGYQMRQNMDAASEFGAGMFPLIASIVITKRLLPVNTLRVGSITGAARATSYAGSKISKSKHMIPRALKTVDDLTKNWASSVAQFAVKDVIVPGLFTVAEWGFAEKFIGENAFGWHSQTLHVDKETGLAELHGSFPFWMGASGSVYGRLQQWAIPRIAGSNKIFKSLYGNWRHWDSSAARFTKGIGGGLGQGATGTVLLQTAEAMRMLTDPTTEGTRKHETRKQEWKDWGATEHLAGTFILMSALGWAGIANPWRKQVRGEVLNLSKDPSKKELKAIEDLEIDKVEDGRIGDPKNKDGTVKGSALRKAVNKKIKENNNKREKAEKELAKLEAENKRLSGKDVHVSELGKKKKIEIEIENKKRELENIRSERLSIERARNIVDGFNTRVVGRKQAEREKRLGEWYGDKYLTWDGAISRLERGNWTAKDIFDLLELDGANFRLALYEGNIDLTSNRGKALLHIHNVLTDAANTLKGADIRFDHPSAKRFLEIRLEGNLNMYEIQRLKHEMEIDPSKKFENKNRIKELEAKNKELIEEYNSTVLDIKKIHGQEFKAAIKDAKSWAAEVGITLNSYKQKRYEKVLQKMYEDQEFDKNNKENNKRIYEEALTQDAFILGDKIIINSTRAKQSMNIGVGVHEMVHGLLRKVLKHNVYNYKGKNYSQAMLNKLKSKDVKLYNKIKKEGVVVKGLTTKKGKAIIDNFLNKLSEKERKILEDEMKERNYTVDEYGNKKHWSEYYEEYITVFAELVKKEKIKRNKITGRRLGKVFVRNILNPLGIGKNWYRFNIGGIGSKNGTSDLYDMIQEIHSEGFSKEVVDWYKSTENLKSDGAHFFSMAKTKDLWTKLDQFTSQTTITTAKNKKGEWVETLALRIGKDGLHIAKYKSNEDFRKTAEEGGDFDRILWDLFGEGKSEQLIREGKYEGSAVEAMDNLIMKPQAIKDWVKNPINKTSRSEFIDNVKKELQKRFVNNFNYDVIPSLTRWLNSKTPAGLTILEHARGDAGFAPTSAKARKKIKTESYDSKTSEGKNFIDFFEAEADIGIKLFEDQVIEFGTKKTERKLKLREVVRLNKQMKETVLKSVEKTYAGKLPDVRTTRTTAKIKGKDASGRNIEEGKVKIDSKNKIVSIVDVKTGKKLFEKKLTEFEFKDLIVKQGEIVRKGQPLVEGYLQALKNGFEIELKKVIQEKILKEEGEFDRFLMEHFEGVFDLMPVKTLMTWESGVKPGERIFTKKIRRTGKKKDIEKLIEDGVLEVDAIDKSAQGVNVYEKLEYPGKEKVLAFFRGYNAKEILGKALAEGTPSNRKGQLAKAIATELAFDASYQVLQMPEMIKRRNDVKEITEQERLKNELAIMMKNINRQPGIMFAKANIKQIESITKDIFQEQFKFEEMFEMRSDGSYRMIQNYGTQRLNQETINKIASLWEQAKLGESPKLKQLIRSLGKNEKWAKEVTKIMDRDGTFTRDNPNLIKKIKPELEKLVSEGYITIDLLKLPGFWDMLGFHKRIMNSAYRQENPNYKIGRKRLRELKAKESLTPAEKIEMEKILKEEQYLKNEFGEFISAEHYAFKQKLIKLAEKTKPNPKLRELIKNSKKQNKNYNLFKSVEKIQVLNIKRSAKIKLAEKMGLMEEIRNANAANKKLNKYIHRVFLDAIKNKDISFATYYHILQAQNSLIGGFRSLTSLDLIDFRDGSQGLYKFKNKKGEWEYTNDTGEGFFIKGEYKNSKGKIKQGKNGKINEKHPDLLEATKFYAKEKNLSIKEAREEAIKKLITKGEHIMPNANTMVEHIKLAWEYMGDTYRNIDMLDSRLDAILNNHSQLYTNNYICDLIDKGGKNNPTHFHRIKFLNEYGYKGNNYIKSLISPEGKSYMELLAAKEISNWTAENKIKALNNKRLIERDAFILENFNLSKKGKKKGMSTFDFDDTMAFTKSGVRGRVPNTDGKPKPRRKVIFLAGGAGSGKGNVIKKLELEKQGFKIVNQDISLEWLKKNHGLPEDMRDLTKEQRSTLGKLGHQARGIARRKMLKFQGRADGVVVDGTGGSMKAMEKLVTEFKEKGYDVSMLFVETSLETALARNAARKERSLLDIIVKRNHESVQLNKPGFKDMFGKRFMEVKTDKLTMESPMPEGLVKKMNDFVSGYEKIRLDAAEFAERGQEILDRGGKFDFSEFNQVVEGTEGPYLQKAIERAKKYGTENMFVLTARPQQSAKSIQEFLKTMGLDIPLKNITGLGNSTGQAKALWMLEKFKEGYNDMYFVDDAFANVEAVKKVLEQLDVKSKIVQAKIQFSKSLNKDFNKILENKFGIDVKKKVSLNEAKMMGGGKLKWDYFVPPSAEDMKGLLRYLLSGGKQGTADMKFFEQSLLRPFAKGIRDLTIVKQKMSEDYRELKKQSKDVDLKQQVEGTNYNVDAAIRAYLWEKNGFEIPDLNPKQQQKLIDHVINNPKLLAFAETLSAITRLKEGYKQPGEFWMVENIASDLNMITKDNLRKQFLAEWIENKNIIFSKENLNKIQSALGPQYREALENILLRMEKGTNRMTSTGDSVTNTWYDWMNGAVGATMFWNTRSAMLQTISTVNFMNWKENNPFAIAKAVANYKQFSKDFAMIFNSPMLKQRRAGLEIDISANELVNMFETHGKNPKAILKYLLQQGFTPTRIADSFAIALGGAPYYRNRYNMYLKQGLSKLKAREEAWLDFQELAEESQQSSRPDFISQQQAGPLGRVILPWHNTPMQMTRLMKKSLSDLVNRRISEPGLTQRQSDMRNISRILYYGAIQNFWFYTLQSGLAWLMFGGSEDEDLIEQKELAVANGAFDTLLRGTGVYGAAVSTLKNTVMRWQKERKKGWGKRDFGNVVTEMINLSPPLGSKARKVYSAIKTFEYNKGVSAELGLRIENPNLHAIANVVEAATNAPMARVLNKSHNIEEAISGDHELWTRASLLGGWSLWGMGIEDEELEAARATVEARREAEKKAAREKEKKQKKYQEELEKKRQGIKRVQCSGTNSNGERCGLMTETKAKTWKCQHHMTFKDGMDRDGDGKKEYRCTAYTKSGNRCKNKTENKNKRCWNHQSSSSKKKNKKTNKTNTTWGNPF